MTVALRTAASEATFVPEANMLCSSLKHAGVELLHQGHGVEAYAQRGKTMGVPLLYPWANRLASFGYEAAGKQVTLPRDPAMLPVDPNGLPIHGVVPGLLRWEVVDHGADRVSARLRWPAELHRVFPFDHEVLMDAALGERELTIATTVVAREPTPVSFGFHPYLVLPGTPRRQWHVNLGAFRRLELDERMIPTGQREPVERRSFVLEETSLDDGFDALAVPPEFEVAGDPLSLAVRFVEGYSFAQVYAPPDQQFICFEPMTAPANALQSGDGLRVLEPSEKHRAVFTIAIAGV